MRLNSPFFLHKYCSKKLVQYPHHCEMEVRICTFCKSFYFFQYLHFLTSVVKLCKKPGDRTCQNEVRTKHYTVIKCLHLTIISSHSHLPYSKGHIFGPPVYKIVESFKEVFLQSKTNIFETEVK